MEISGIDQLQGANLISVDIQPEYQNAFGFNIYDYLQFLNNNFNELNSLTFLYNGKDTLGMVDENKYKYWLYENGFDEDNLYYSKDTHFLDIVSMKA